MEILSNNFELNIFLKKNQYKSIGFVPTMGAIHKGHISLIKTALHENEIAICSIYVNPTQFNDVNDFTNYPKKINDDINLLIKHKCSALFIPQNKEIYPNGYKVLKHENNLFNILEGKFRPNHFDGVVFIVHRLLKLINPRIAYFGEKDYQQLIIIKKFVGKKFKNTIIRSCPTVRNNSGLALSSRNILLSDSEYKEANFIFKNLKLIQKIHKKHTISECKKIIALNFENNKAFKLDYFEICNSHNLTTSVSWEDNVNHVLLIAVFIGRIRLIDNLVLNVN